MGHLESYYFHGIRGWECEMIFFIMLLNSIRNIHSIIVAKII
jgi:hypothetical protein